MKIRKLITVCCICLTVSLTACGGDVRAPGVISDHESSGSMAETKERASKPVKKEAVDEDADSKETDTEESDTAASVAETSDVTDFEKGEINDHTYYNKYEGIKIKVPDDWYVMSEEDLAKENRLTLDTFTDKAVEELAGKKKEPMVFWAHNDDIEKSQMVIVKALHGITAHLVTDKVDIDKVKEQMEAVLEANNYKYTDVRFYEINGGKYLVPIFGTEFQGRDSYNAVLVYGEKEYTLMITISAYSLMAMEDMINDYITKY